MFIYMCALGLSILPVFTGFLLDFELHIGVIVIVFVSMVVYRGFEHRSGRTKD